MVAGSGAVVLVGGLDEEEGTSDKELSTREKRVEEEHILVATCSFNFAT